MAQHQTFLETLDASARELADVLRLPPPRGQTGREQLVRAGERVLESPDLEGVDLLSPAWQEDQAGLASLIDAGTAYARIRAEFSSALTQEAWGQDLGPDASNAGSHRAGGWVSKLSRKFPGDYRTAEKQLASLCQPPRPKDLERRLQLMDAVLETQVLLGSISQNARLGAELFGLKWRGEASDWAMLSQLAAWVGAVHEDVHNGNLPPDVYGSLTQDYSREQLIPLLEEVRRSMSIHADTASAIYESLEASRKDLLDLGLRNPLLNYRLLRTRGLEVSDELPAQVHRLLVEEGKNMSFLPASEDELADDLGQPAEEETAVEGASRHADNRLQTVLSSQELQTRLLSTYRMARTFIQEQGVNTLFLALGMLDWRESENQR